MSLELPGRLILVVGPSGAGKDSLIRYARERLAGTCAFVFPHRVVTRPPSEAEDNIEVDERTFGEMLAAGAFAASWTAHGLGYGISATIDAELAAGRSVVCNVSRTAVQALRARYPNILVIEITAPPEVLAARLAARGRTADGDIRDRLARSDHLTSRSPDIVLRNDGPLDRACEAFMSALYIGQKREDAGSALRLPQQS